MSLRCNRLAVLLQGVALPAHFSAFGLQLLLKRNQFASRLGVRLH